MTRLGMSALTVLALAGLAVAANPGAFDFGPGVAEPLGILPGDSATIVISAVGTGTVQGANINLRLDEPFKIESIEMLVGTVFDGNNTGYAGGAPVIFNDPLAPDSYADYVQAATTTSNGTVPVAPGSVVAKLVISVAPGTPADLLGALVSYDPNDSFTLPCDWTDGASVGQDTLQLKVLPEPASALLLLAAMPLIRRRRA